MRKRDHISLLGSGYAIALIGSGSLGRDVVEQWLDQDAGRDDRIVYQSREHELSMALPVSFSASSVSFRGFFTKREGLTSKACNFLKKWADVILVIGDVGSNTLWELWKNLTTVQGQGVCIILATWPEEGWIGFCRERADKMCLELLKATLSVVLLNSSWQIGLSANQNPFTLAALETLRALLVMVSKQSIISGSLRDLTALLRDVQGPARAYVSRAQIREGWPGSIALENILAHHMKRKKIKGRLSGALITLWVDYDFALGELVESLELLEKRVSGPVFGSIVRCQPHPGQAPEGFFQGGATVIVKGMDEMP